MKRASAIPSGNYTYLFEEEKPAGYDQVLQLTAFNGTTQTAPIKHRAPLKNEELDSNVSFEVSADISGLTLKPDEIYTIAIINKPIKTITQLDTNIDSTTTAVADNAKFAMQKTTRHAEGNMEVLDVTDIYTAHFRTSSYGTFSEKMDGFEVENYKAIQIAGTVYQLVSNIVDICNKPEVFDGYEYDFNNPQNNLLILTPDYNNMKWYNDEIAPLIYENSDVRNVLGNIKPPIGISMVALGLVDNNKLLAESELANGIFSARVSTGAFSINISKYINLAYCEYVSSLASYSCTHTVGNGVVQLLQTDCIPGLIEGIYPFYVQYKLPGKNYISSTKQINIEYQY